MFTVTTTSRNLTPPSPGRPPTIWEALATKLGREPTNEEAAADVRRILREGHDDAITRAGRAQDRALGRRR